MTPCKFRSRCPVCGREINVALKKDVDKVLCYQCEVYTKFGIEPSGRRPSHACAREPLRARAGAGGDRRRIGVTIPERASGTGRRESNRQAGELVGDPQGCG